MWTSTTTSVLTISSNLIKRAIPLCSCGPVLQPKSPLILSLSSAAIPQKHNTTTSIIQTSKRTYQMRFSGDQSPEFPGKTPPEFPARTPDYQPTTVPLEVPEIPNTPEIDPSPPEEITVPEPPSPGQWPDPSPDIPIPPPPSTPPDPPLPPAGTDPLPPPPDKLPPDPSPDIIPPYTPPNIEPTPSVPPEIQRPTGPLG